MTLINQYFDDVLRDGKRDLLDDIIHPAFIPFQDPKYVNSDRDEPQRIPGIEGIKERIRLLSEQFADLNFHRMDVVETKETVIVHYEVTTTHVGTWNDIPASGAKISTYGFHLFKFKDDKIFSITWMLNITDVLTQLGNAIITEKDDLPDYLESIRKLLKL